jgi:hypothetical protein
MHEAALHEDNSFVTLTYSDAPEHLVYSDFQAFMRRLRKVYKGISFYMSGEYGAKNGRPHFHALLFGVGFSDRTFVATSPSGLKLYESKRLSELWRHGYASVGDVTFESAGYVARYVYKKMTSEEQRAFNGVGEFSRMSLRPAVGKRWLDKFGASDVLPHGTIVVKGVEGSAPRYYRRELRKRFPLTYRSLLFPEVPLRDNREIAASVKIRAAAMKNVNSKDIS